MIVASLDPVTETVSMVSIPRDMVDVPLPDGRKFTGKINGLVSYARHHPKQFPGSDGTGFDVLRGALGKLLGLDIPYHAAVNLGASCNVINTLGGINVYVARSFCDPTYDEYGFTRGFSITKGRHHLNGQQALAYARVRKPAGESDFTRAARQQEVLSGIRDRIVQGGFINDPIGLLRALGKTITTNVPRKILPDLADAMAKIGREDTYPDGHHLAARARLGPRRARLDPDPDLKRIDDAVRSALPARRDAAAREAIASAREPRGRPTSSGRRRLPPRRDPTPDREAHGEADPEADGQADGDAGADRRADGEPTPDPTPEPTAEPTP